MSVSLEAKLQIGTLMPGFELHSLDGTIVSTWDYKQHQNLALVFLHGGVCLQCIDFLKQTAENYPQYEDDNTVLLAIVRGDKEQADQLCQEICTPFQILYDPSGEVIDAYTNILPAVFVADHYGELRAQWIIGDQNNFPSQKEILDVVELANLECPECGT